MLKEHFKKRLSITDITDDGRLLYHIDDVNLVMHTHMLSDEGVMNLFPDPEEHTFSSEDKVFFLPGSSVPRFKVRELFRKEGILIRKSPSSANVVIVGDKTLDVIIKQEVIRNSLTKDYLLQVLKTHFPKDPLIRDLEDEDIFEMVSVNGILREIASVVNPDYYSASWVWKMNAKVLNDVETIIDNNIKIVYQDDLIKILNKGVSIDYEMYLETIKMFESTDSSNHVLAMELMANCDYQKSCVYLLELLSDFFNIINQRREKNHVNFRSMLEFFSVNNAAPMTIDEKIETLVRKRLLTSEVLEDLKKVVLKNVNNSSLDGYFKVSNITPLEHLLETVKEIDKEHLAQQPDQSENTSEDPLNTLTVKQEEEEVETVKEETND